MNGVLGDVKNEKCVYKLPDKIQYETSTLEFHRDHSLQHALQGCTRESELPLLCTKHCKPVQCIWLLFSLSLETA